MARTISIGNQSFQELREKGYFFVDKTSFIKEWWESADTATLIDVYKRQITHSTRILESLHVDATHVLVDGRIVASGDGSLVDEINENGFERFL